MKKIGLVLALLGLFSVCSAMELPNLETSILLDNDGKLTSGLTSKLISYKDLDLRVGLTEEGRWIGGLSYDIKKLEKLGSEISYVWKDALNLSLLAWLGWDFDQEKVKWGISAVVIEIKF